jgi:hypothetical protein
MFLLSALVVAIWILVLWVQPLAALSVFECLTPNVILTILNLVG